MALYSDPQFNRAVDEYFNHDHDIEYIYQGSTESIIEELKAWVIRRKQVYKEQLELRHQAQESTKLGLASPHIARDPEYVSQVVKRHARTLVRNTEKHALRTQH